MTQVTVSLQGMEEVKMAFSKNKLDTATILAVGQASKELRDRLSAGVKARYAARNDLRKLFVSSASTLKTSKNLIQQGLVYRIQYSDLSKFPTSWAWGNINPKARHRGRVHTTEVIRGKPKIIRGSRNRGGFIPRDHSGRPLRLFKSGSQMLERTSDRHLPLAVLYAPSTQGMINYVLEHDPEIPNILDQMQETIARVFSQ